MNEKEYNGWTNYETWNVNLHLDEMYQRIANEHTLLSTYHLGQLLKDGRVRAKEGLEEAFENGIADRTLKRARKKLGIKATRIGIAGESKRKGEWWWSMPPIKGANEGVSDGAD